MSAFTCQVADDFGRFNNQRTPETFHVTTKYLQYTTRLPLSADCTCYRIYNVFQYYYDIAAVLKRTNSDRSLNGLGTSIILHNEEHFSPFDRV